MESIEELIAERSAILEYMFGFTREEADREAARRIHADIQERSQSLQRLLQERDMGRYLKRSSVS